MRYLFTPSLLAAVVVAGHTSNEATAMSVDKESLLRREVRRSGKDGTAAPGGRLMTSGDATRRTEWRRLSCHVART